MLYDYQLLWLIQNIDYFEYHILFYNEQDFVQKPSNLVLLLCRLQQLVPMNPFLLESFCVQLE